MKNRFPRLEILQSLYNLTEDVADTRFITNRPEAVGEQVDKYLTIRISQPIVSRGDTYMTSTAQITVFARDIQGVGENTYLLEEMQSKVMQLFPITTELYRGKRPILLPAGADGAGFHALIIQFNLLIF